MEILKIGDAEKTEEEKLWKLKVKFHAFLSCAFRLISDEFPEKFGKTIHGSFLNEKTIELTGDVDVFQTEVYERVIEYNGEKETYKIILKKK